MNASNDTTVLPSGPWEVLKDEDGQRLWISEVNGAAVGVLTPDASSFAVARLIAAAPEMLAALERAEYALKQTLRCLDTHEREAIRARRYNDANSFRNTALIVTDDLRRVRIAMGKAHA